jgi:N4-gp56 family major capsid protein
MALTQVSSLDFTQKAFEQMAYFPLRPELFFDSVADVKPNYQSYPGSSVQFTIMNDMALATSTISETTDLTPVALSDSTITVTLGEYGNVATTTAKLRAESFVEIDPIVANNIGYNAGASIDSVARNTLRDAVLANGPQYWGNSASGTLVWTAGTPGSFSGTPTTAVGGDFAKQRARLRSSNVVPFEGGFYVAFVHPDVVYDIQQDTGTAGWRLPQIYTTPENIWSGEMGAFEGFRFIETPRAPVFPNSTTTVNLTASSLNFTFTAGLPPTVGQALTMGTATLSAGTATVATVNANTGTGTITISSSGTVSGSGTATVAGTVPADQIASGIAYDVFMSLTVGRQSLAKAYAASNGYGEMPTVVMGPVIDTLRRFQPVGWKALLGYGGFRAPALRAVLSKSSLSYIDPEVGPIDE